VRAGDLTFAHARALVDDVVVVSEVAIAEATRRLMASSKLVVEFSGAATVAALLSERWRPRGRRCAAILSGGNLDPVRAAEVMRAPAGRPREGAAAVS
jgi:threonine dehydratase